MSTFFARHPDLFDWQASDGSCTAFPRYTGPDGVEAFTRRLVDESSVLLLPASIFASALSETPRDRFRIGFGRSGLDEGLAALEAHLARNRA